MKLPLVTMSGSAIYKAGAAGAEPRPGDPAAAVIVQKISSRGINFQACVCVGVPHILHIDPIPELLKGVGELRGHGLGCEQRSGWVRPGLYAGDA